MNIPDYMLRIFLVSVGAVIGANARYILVQLCVHGAVGTLLVNLLGCLIMGCVSTSTKNPELRLFLMTGLLGAFTTFSSFALDVNTLQKHSIYHAIAYILASVIGGVGAFYAGRWLVMLIAAYRT